LLLLLQIEFLLHLSLKVYKNAHAHREVSFIFCETDLLFCKIVCNLVSIRRNDRFGDGEGRRPRHREEHRWRRFGLQQLQGRRPRRHDSLRRNTSSLHRRKSRHCRTVR